VEPAALALVSAHPWDIHGAKTAGLPAGFVARGHPYPNVLLKPNAIGQSLTILRRSSQT
jgi:2-haloacid dehalogenase